MDIGRAAGVIASLLATFAAERLLQKFAPRLRLVRAAVVSLVSVAVLSVAWHGFSWTSLREIVLLTSVSFAFRYTTERVREYFGGVKGLAMGFVAGHLAAGGVAFTWLVLAWVYITLRDSGRHSPPPFPSLSTF